MLEGYDEIDGFLIEPGQAAEALRDSIQLYSKVSTFLKGAPLEVRVNNNSAFNIRKYSHSQGKNNEPVDGVDEFIYLRQNEGSVSFFYLSRFKDAQINLNFSILHKGERYDLSLSIIWKTEFKESNVFGELKHEFHNEPVKIHFGPCRSHVVSPQNKDFSISFLYTGRMFIIDVHEYNKTNDPI